MGICMITGATSGIGEATAILLAEQGYKLILCGRREERLEGLKNKLAATTDVTTLCFDVGDKEQVDRSIAAIPEAFKNVDVLINNAGNAHGLSHIYDGDVADWDAMIDSNVKGLLYVTRKLLPMFTERGSGHIVNVGSIAGKEVYPRGNVYCATKFAVDALTKAMRIDLNPFGIKVTAIHPGLVETEFSLVRFKGDAERASQTYAGINPLLARDVADVIRYTLACPPHVVLADVVILPTAQAGVYHLKRDE